MQLNLLDSLYAEFINATPIKSEAHQNGQSYVKAVIVICCTLLKEPNWKQLQNLKIGTNHWPGVKFDLDQLATTTWPEEAQSMYLSMVLQGKIDLKELTLTILNNSAGKDSTANDQLYTARNWIHDSDSMLLKWFLTGTLR